MINTWFQKSNASSNINAIFNQVTKFFQKLTSIKAIFISDISKREIKIFMKITHNFARVNKIKSNIKGSVVISKGSIKEGQRANDANKKL